MKLLAIVPAFNESPHISNVIHSLSSKFPQADILVVNDCSNDNTKIIVEQTGKSFLINLPVNLGIGGAVQTGFKFAAKHNYDVAFQFDGDGQHKASEIQKLLNPILRGEADVSIGSRFINENKKYIPSLSRKLGIKILQIVNRLLTKQKITDNTSGFRAYNKKVIHFFAYYYPTDFPEPEAIVLLSKNRFRITEIFVDMQERQGGYTSIYGLRPFYYMIKVLLALFITSLRPRIDTTKALY